MIGVILWSDPADRKAVIWCEDHGELAFFSCDAVESATEIDVGDVVRFELRSAGAVRRVEQLDILKKVSGTITPPDPQQVYVATAAQRTAQIIPFRYGAHEPASDDRARRVQLQG